MSYEAEYIDHLVAYEVADQLLGGIGGPILRTACNEWVRSTEIGEQIRAIEAQQGEGQQPNSNNDGERT